MKVYIGCKVLILNIKGDLFIESFKETKIEKCENSNMELLQENTCFLQKELLAKNDIIKSMIETQKVGLETFVNLDEKPQDQQELANVTYKQQIQQHCQDDKIISINFK